MKTVSVMPVVKSVVVGASLFSLSVSFAFDQTHSDKLASLLKEQASTHLNADLALGSLELNTLTEQLVATDVQLGTRVPELDQGLNQLVYAERFVVHGDWLAQSQQSFAIERVIAEQAQVTIAYYDKGQSNLHYLIESVSQQNRRQGFTNVSWQGQTADQSTIWQVQEIQLRDVVINLFDKGHAVASVRVEQLDLPPIDSAQSTNEYVWQVLWPIMKKLTNQVIEGDSPDVVVDSRRLMQFMWREAR